MKQIKITNFIRSFDSDKIIKYKEKENKKWQWIVLICCLLFQMFPFCISSNLVGALMSKDWSQWTNNNQTIMSITFTIGALAAALVGPFIAKLFGKSINMRLVYIIGVIACMLGFFAYGLNAFIPSEKRTIPIVACILYSSNIISQIGLMIFSGLGINNLISKWWPSHKRGFALGIAYTGGSIGNIWLQQLLQQLSIRFGNNNNLDDGGSGNRWITYLILALMGLIVGIICAIIANRRPLPPNNIFGDKPEIIGQNLNAIQSASILNTKKYAPYWLLAIGFLILQFGTIHSSLSTQFITNGVAYANNFNPSQLIANGLTVFGVFSLIGNLTGGIINQKFGPTKSIAYAGLLQIISVFLLIYSVNDPNIVYLYYALNGLSIYLYTSTPAFIAGKLFGPSQSNNHMAILGIFLAFGYGIVNLVIGPIIGPGNITTELFNKTVRTNLLAFSLFVIISLTIAILMICVCCAIIQKKGIKGLIQYSPTKFTWILNQRYGFKIWFYRKFIDQFIDDLKYKKIINNSKYVNNNEYNYLNRINKLMFDRYSKELTNNQIKLLAKIYFYNITLNSILKANYKDLEILENKNLIWTKQTNIDTIVYLNNNHDFSFPKENNKIIQNNLELSEKLYRLKIIVKRKNKKLNLLIQKLKKIKINESKDKQNKEKANNLIQKIKHKLALLKQQTIKNEYNDFEKEYYLLKNLENANKLINKEENDIKNKISLLQKKIETSKFVNVFDIITTINGYNKLADLLNDEYNFLKITIYEKINDDIENKIRKLNIENSIIK